MKILTLEYNRFTYALDFVVYGVAALGLAAGLGLTASHWQWLELAALVPLGVLLWTALEYAIHRFLMHGLDPVRRWHGEHHRRPMALIGSPTLVSAPLWVVLVFLPIAALSDTWRASALLLGILLGYLAYAITHHAVHHWRCETRWLRERRRWHALHHATLQPVCFGVTTAVWDQLLGSVAGGSPARGLRMRGWPMRMPAPRRRPSHSR